MNSAVDFDNIYSSSFKQAYTLCFVSSASHELSTRCLRDIYLSLYDDSITFKTLDEACDYVLSRVNYQIYREIANAQKSKKSIQNSLDVIEDSKLFYINLVHSALEQKSLREVYVMKFFMHFSPERISLLIKQPIAAVNANLDRARNLVSLAYKSKTL